MCTTLSRNLEWILPSRRHRSTFNVESTPVNTGPWPSMHRVILGTLVQTPPVRGHCAQCGWWQHETVDIDDQKSLAISCSYLSPLFMDVETNISQELWRTCSVWVYQSLSTSLMPPKLRLNFQTAAIGAFCSANSPEIHSEASDTPARKPLREPG